MKFEPTSEQKSYTNLKKKQLKKCLSVPYNNAQKVTCFCLNTRIVSEKPWQKEVSDVSSKKRQLLLYFVEYSKQKQWQKQVSRIT